MRCLAFRLACDFLPLSGRSDCAGIGTEIYSCTGITALCSLNSAASCGAAARLGCSLAQNYRLFQAVCCFLSGLPFALF